MIAAVIALAAIGGALTAGLFVWPRTGEPGQVDAVVVLSGDRGERLAKGLSLLRAGVSSTLVLDGAPDSLEAVNLCTTPQAFEVVCLRPQPDSTRHEARAAARLASERNWQRVAVVTTTVHVTRAGMLFRRCLDASVVMVAGYRPPTLRALVHEWLGLGKALTFARGC